MAGTTHTPLRRAMLVALAERDWTYRRLAQETAAKGARGGRGLTHSFLNQVARGEERPTLDVINAICDALELDRDTIAEYQLAQARRLFDERPPPMGVGLDEAIANLEANEPEEAAGVLATALEEAAGPAAPEPARPAKPARAARGRGSGRSAS